MLSSNVDVFAARLREIRPGITVVNYGCPGESTRSFLKGPCLWTEFGEQLHDPFIGAQFDAAVSFLRSHPGEVSPITLTLWGNNVREFVGSCQDDVCVQNGAFKFIRDLNKDLEKILGELRKEAPDADIIVTGSWDSFIDALEFADPLFQLLNASMAATAAAKGVRFADPFPLFNPQGDLQHEIETLCALLLLCTSGDSHPSNRINVCRSVAAIAPPIPLLLTTITTKLLSQPPSRGRQQAQLIPEEAVGCY